MANFATADDYSDDFLTMNREQQLQYLNDVSDKMRALRKQVLDTQAAEAFIDKSTQTFVGGWQGDLKLDITGEADPAHGQDVTIKTRASDFWSALDDIA